MILQVQMLAILIWAEEVVRYTHTLAFQLTEEKHRLAFKPSWLVEKEKCNLSKWVLCSHFLKKLLTKFKLSRSKSPRDAILFSQHMSLLMEPLLGRQSQPQEELGASSAFSSMATRSAFQLCRVPTHAVHMRMLVPRPVAVVRFVRLSDFSGQLPFSLRYNPHRPQCQQ